MNPSSRCTHTLMATYPARPAGIWAKLHPVKLGELRRLLCLHAAMGPPPKPFQFSRVVSSTFKKIA